MLVRCCGAKRVPAMSAEAHYRAGHHHVHAIAGGDRHQHIERIGGGTTGRRVSHAAPQIVMDGTQEGDHRAHGRGPGGRFAAGIRRYRLEDGGLDRGRQAGGELLCPAPAPGQDHDAGPRIRAGNEAVTVVSSGAVCGRHDTIHQAASSLS